MRSLTEISFRLQQETGNLLLYLNPPAKTPPISRLPLPDAQAVAARLRGTPFAGQLYAVAEQILARKIPLLGYEIEVPDDIRWRRDEVHGRETPPVYFRRIPYLDFARAGDHKIVWELNRHQHLVALAQASLLSGRNDFVDQLFAQLNSWLQQNPVCCGINWTSALEVAFRALSWIWIHHLAGDRMPPPLTSRWLLSLFHHGCYLERNLSVYFSPNTHLQGEALALHALGLLFGVHRWRQRGAGLMEEMIHQHVLPDGGHFEQSSYYHVYSTDMFLFHAVLEAPSPAYREKLKSMARYLWALAGSGTMPFFGDDDGGRLFYPFGDRSRFARATLAACAAFFGDTPSLVSDSGEHASDLHEIAAWWLGNEDRAGTAESSPRASAFFPATGMATLVDGSTELVASVRAFGRGSAGHSHAHALHFTLRHAGEDVLIDPGTYTYVSDPLWRDRFRGTAAHNTIRIDRLDQADPAGPFRWSNLPAAEILDWSAAPWRLHAFCASRGIRHDRRIFFSAGAVWVVDDVSGAGRHRIEQFWHAAGPDARAADGSIHLPGGMRLLVSGGRTVEIEEAWRSPVPGIKLPVPVLCVAAELVLPCRFVAVFDSHPGPADLQVETHRITLGDRELEL